MHLGLLSQQTQEAPFFSSPGNISSNLSSHNQQPYPGEATERISMGLSLLHLSIEPDIELPRL